MKKIIFTDLDGTLLDLYTYSSDLVKESVEKLRSAGVSIIFCSSKTWAEQEFYLNELQLQEPVIVENGSGIFLPEKNILHELLEDQATIVHHRSAIKLGLRYEHILEAIEKVASVHYPQLKYYANQSINQIAQIAGLSLEEARKAKARDFSETLFNADQGSDAYHKFENALKSHGFQCIPGSKYVTVTGSESNKGRAVKMLLEAYNNKYQKVISYGIGDSLNDVAMLQEVNFPYLVQKPDETWADIHLDKMTKIGAVGPAGWNMMAKEILVS